MNTYYTAKDIEELAANGTKELVLGPGVFLTDYARETAQQLGVALTRNENRTEAKKPKACLPKAAPASDKYNKPRGCQAATNLKTAEVPLAAKPSSQSNGSNANGAGTANVVSHMIDLMGKVIKRGS